MHFYKRRVVILVAVIFALTIIMVGYFLFIRNKPVAKIMQLIQKDSQTEKSSEDQGQPNPADKTFQSKRGTIVDMYGDPIQEHIELYLDPIPGTGADMEAGRLTFRIQVNGGFEFYVEKLGAYNLSFQDGWYSDQMDNINPIDFRKMTDGYRIVVHNKERDAAMLAKYTEEVQHGDTLWSIAEKHYGQGYFWPLLARANNLDQTGGIPEIFPGNKLVITPLSKFSQTDVEAIRLAFHAGNFGENITSVNQEFGYSIVYPGRWIIQTPITRVYDENAEYYNSYIYLQTIVGPDYRKEFSSNKWLAAGVSIFIYDNRVGRDLEEFVIYRKITEQSLIQDGFFRIKNLANGGTLITDGYYGGMQHLIFFKGGLIYDLAFSPINFVEQTDPIIADEIMGIINSFQFIK